MKIVEVAAVFPPYRGGIGSVCRQNARMLAAAGHEVTVLTPWYRRLRSTTKEVEQQEGYTIRRLKPLIEFGNAAMIPQVREYLKDVDVVHLHMPFIGVGKEFSLSKSQKLIVTYHMDLIGRDWKRFFFNRYTNKTQPRIIARADKILVSSLDYGRHSNIAAIMRTSEDRFIEIPNTVDTSFYYPKEKNQELMNRHGIKRDDRVILFVGAIDSAHYFKGVEYLIKAFGILVSDARYNQHTQDYKLVIVGDGDLRPQYHTLAHEMGLTDRIIFAGNPSDSEVVDYYNLSDVMVLPSIDSSEAFGIVLVEAMACAKPVITTDLPGPRSVVEEGWNGLLVPTHDEVALAEKIDMILSDGVLAETMGKRSKDIVDQKYSHTVVSQRLQDLVLHL